MLLLADSLATRAWFVGDFVPELLEFVLVTWSAFQRDPSVRLEQRITNRFSDALEEAYELQGKHWFLVPDMKRTDPRTGKEIARHDIRFFHREISGQRLYFIFECKRLNVSSRRKKIVPNSSGYLAGMIKFVNDTYGAGLPCGGMIGYVMDSNLTTALITIQKLIRKNRNQLQLSPGGDYCPSPLMAGYAYNGETKHSRRDGDFTLYHLLLS
jgi:hypothetical protein